jgi:hypothetical protein
MGLEFKFNIQRKQLGTTKGEAKLIPKPQQLNLEVTGRYAVLSRTVRLPAESELQLYKHGDVEKMKRWGRSTTAKAI